MSEEQFWHYIAAGEKQGPVSVEQLHGLVADGTITPDTQVWTESLEEWTAASNLEGLFPDQAVPPQGPTLITGEAAQVSTPLAAAPVAQPVTAQAPGFSLGGSLAGGPHFAGGGMAPGTEQRLQIRSVGVLQMGLFGMCMGVVIAILYNVLMATIFGALLSWASAATGGSLPIEAAGGMGISWLISLLLTSLLGAICGFIQGVMTAAVYNLAARMCGGIVLKLKALPNW
jgi:hypothetical protein